MKIEMFNVVRIRFHITDKNVLILQGWKHEMKDSDSLEIMLDDQILSFDTETDEGVEVRQRYMIYDLGIGKEYFLYVKLPSDFSEGRELVLWGIKGNVKQKIYRVNVKELLKLQKQVDYFIEDISVKNGTGIITGWAAGEKPVEINIKHQTGNPIDFHLKRNERRDVMNSYKEMEIDPSCGFTITIPVTSGGKLYLELASGNKHSKIAVPKIGRATCRERV